MHSLLRIATLHVQSQSVSRLLHTTSMLPVDYRWRRKNKLPEHVRQEPEFYDRPDFSYLDGRPTPLGKQLKRRYEDEQRLAADAVKYIGQINYALEREVQQKIEAEEHTKTILSRKLNPKGPAYKPKHSKDKHQ